MTTLGQAQHDARHGAKQKVLGRHPGNCAFGTDAVVRHQMDEFALKPEHSAKFAIA